MVAALIIISIAFICSFFGNIFLMRILNSLTNILAEEEQVEQELAFSAGEIDIPEDEIAQKFLDATILYRINKSSSDDNNIAKNVDISNFEKNQVIGLTYFVQPQDFEDIKAGIDMDKRRENMRNMIIDELYDDDEDAFAADEDLIDDIIQQVIPDDKYISENVITLPLLPHCTVYQLKDGRWLWRQETP